MKVTFYLIVSLIAFGVHHVDSIRRRHEVRSGGARTATTLQVFRLYEPSFQSQVALQPLRQRLAAIQGSRPGISRVRESHQYPWQLPRFQRAGGKTANSLSIVNF